MANYKQKIAMKFNISQLDRTIVALLNNGENKKFANNVLRLFNNFTTTSINDDIEKTVRVYLIKQISNIILKNNITDKNAILSFIDPDGKYYNHCNEVLNNLFEEEIPEQELILLDKTISNQLKYVTLEESADTIIDMLTNLKTENYDDLDEYVKELETQVESVNKEIKSARESLEDAKKDLNLGSAGFVNFLNDVIQEERNPSVKIKTGIQYLNNMLNGGFERGQIYKKTAPII